MLPNLLKDVKIGIRIGVRWSAFRVRVELRGKPVLPLVKRSLDVLNGLGPREQVSLPVVAAEILKHGELGFSLDALGDDLHTQVLGQ